MRVSRKPFRRFDNYLLGCASEICAPVLRGLGKLLVPTAKSPPHSWRRGLILSHTRIGDVLFRTASLERLKQGLPSCEWHYLTAPDSADVLCGNLFLKSALPFCGCDGGLHLIPGAAKDLRA